MESDALVIGVDGGGTKTLAWLAVLDGDRPPDIIGRGKAGPANPCSVGLNAATSAIQSAINLAFADADRPVAQVAAACFSIAGTDPPAERRRVEDWARQQAVAKRIRMSNDAEPILACAGEGWGVALISGTGSFALGRAPTGETARVGGWGYLVGDEGSGYAIAVAALTAAFRSVDGRGPRTSLLPQFLEACGVADPSSLISYIYHPDMQRRRIADLAPLVMELAAAGDQVASMILQAAAESLSEMVLTLCTRLQLPSPLPLAVTGGVVVHSEAIRSSIAGILAREGIRPEIQLVAEPVRGAVELAAEAARQPE